MAARHGLPHHPRPTRRGRLGSVRVRTTLAAVLIVGSALLSACIGLVWATRHAVTENVRDAATIYAEGLVEQLDAGVTPDGVEMSDGDELLIQILGPGREVERSSRIIAGRPAVADLRPGESRDLGKPTHDDRFLGVAVGTKDGLHTVLVARSSDVVDESTNAVTGFLLVGLPLMVVLVGATTWRLVGRTLRPVESIRREVAEISVSELHRRVPVAGGGDEVTRLAATMNQMLERLEQGQETLRRFVSDASHELRSPIAAIRQNVEVALAHPDQTTMKELAETVQAEGLRVQQLIEDLLLLARGEEGTPAPGRPVDLDDLMFAEAARLRGATSLRIDTTGVSAGRIIGDERSLSRVLHNLGENAARHAAGTIAFSLRESNGQVVAAVDDDGPGIPESERDRVFDRFVRLDEARTRDDGGAGLGLSIVAQVVAAHHGTVLVDATPLGGARFELRFPRHDA
jgi:signal transduction histidine kinase